MLFGKNESYLEKNVSQKDFFQVSGNPVRQGKVCKINEVIKIFSY